MKMVADPAEKLEEEGEKVEKEVKKEEKWLLREYYHSEQFKTDLEESQKNRSANRYKLASGILVNLGADQSRLDREHEKVLKKIKDWKGDIIDELNHEEISGRDQFNSFFSRIEGIEGDIEVFRADLTKNLSRFSGEITKKSIEKKPEETKEEVRKLIEEIQGWVTLDKRLESIIEDMNEFLKTYDARSNKLQNYKHLNAAPQEKLHDLLLGRKYYKKFSQEQRKDLWNRWARSSTQKVLINLDASNARLDRFDFSRFIFKGETNFAGASLEYVYFTNANLQGANLQGANLFNVKMWEATLIHANLSGSNLRLIHLEKSNMLEADFRNANLSEAYLTESVLRGANLKGANLQFAKIIRADLQGANLQGAQLIKATVAKSNLANVNLMYANLQEAHLDLSEFNGANLQEANLQDADLEQAFLPSANLTGANLKGTNLKTVDGLTAEQLHSAKNWQEAKNIPTDLI